MAKKEVKTDLWVASQLEKCKIPAYARKWRPSRMVHSCIMLPVDNRGEPDYEFMEECGRKIMAKKYAQYLEYLERQK